MRSSLRRLPIGFFLLPLLFITVAQHLHGQRIVVSTIDARDFPTVGADLYILGPDGREILDLGASDFIVTENGERRQVVSLECPPSPKPQMISSVLTIDVSGSMERPGATGTTRNIDLAQAAANAWVDGLPTDGSSCALTSFDSRGLIQLDFSQDRSLLRGAISSLRPNGGTNYNAGLLDAPSGALTVAATGRGRRVIVFLTDGRGDGDEDRIVEMARGLNASIFCVTLGMPAPDILKNIAARTGGGCYENVTTVDEAQAIYRAILYRAIGGLPCRLVWKSVGACDGKREVGLSVPSRNLSGVESYKVPPETMAGLRFDPPVLFFGKVPPGERRELIASISAVNKPVTVTGIEASSTSGAMSMEGIATPFTLQPGEVRQVRVVYAPTDDKATTVRWRFANDGCNGGALLGTSSGNRRQDPSIHLIMPNGGERFRPGETTTIRWEGVAAETPVKLDYSTDAGAHWTTVAPRTSGLRFEWVVPGTPSERCYARVSELASDASPITPVIGDSSAKHRAINSIAVSGDGSLVITASGGTNDEPKSGRMVVWSTATGAAVMELNARDIRNSSGMKPQIYYAGFSPDGKRIVTVNHGRVVGSTTYVETYIELFDGATGAPVTSFKGSLANGSMFVEGARTRDLRYTGENDKIPISSPFSPDGKVFVAITDSLPTLFDAATGRQLRRLAAPKETVRSVVFSSDGKQAATAGVDGFARIFDVATGRQTQQIALTGTVMQVGFSPDGTILGATCEDDKVRFFDVQSGRLVTEILGKKSPGSAINSQPNTFLFAPGGDRVLVANWGRMVPTLFSFPDGRMIQEYTAIDEGELYPARQNIGGFSPDGTMLAFTGEHRGDDGNYTTKIADVATGTVVARSYVGAFSHGVRQPIFTPDGSAIITAGNGVPVIQPIGGGAIQQDRSDALWAIVASNPSAIDVDFGGHPVGQTTDSIITALIRNEGPDTLVVGEMKVSGENGRDFGVTMQPVPRTIAPNQAARAELRFTPTAIGERTATLEIEAGGKKLTPRLSGIGLAPQLRVATQSIDFGNVLIGATRDTTIDLLLRNEGATPLTIRNVRMLGPDTSHFTVIDGEETMILPGEAHAMSFRFSPDTIGRRSTRLLVRHNGIGEEETIDLNGRGVVPGRERVWHDPTTFRTIAIPNAILPPKGSVVAGIYDFLGLMAGYVPVDHVMILGGGGLPLPDDWGGLNGQAYGAWSIGVKTGFWVVDQWNVGGGFQYAESYYDREETPETESHITMKIPYLAASYGDDKSRVSVTFAYSYRLHQTLAPDPINAVIEYNREARLLGIGGDYQFGSRWKVAAEILTMDQLGYIPIAATVRYFSDTWAVDGGLGFVGITTGGGTAPDIPIVPVLSVVAVF